MGDVERHPAEADTGDARVVVRVATRIENVPAADWDACAAGGGEFQQDSIRPDNPFVSHAFLKALEDSGSAARETGWLPQHLLYEDGDGRLLACMPCYLKSHSQGEYVFDHGWADAYERAGGRYYPKLQASVPFTPVTGRRLMIKPGPDADPMATTLSMGAATLAGRLGVSSLHVTFATAEEWEFLGAHGFLQR